MRIKFLIYFLVMFIPSFYVKGSDTTNTTKNDKEEVIQLTPIQIINLSKKFIADKNFDDAKVLLTKTPFDILELDRKSVV